MYAGYIEAFGEPTDRLMVVPAGVGAPDWAMVGEHPIPGGESLRAAQVMKEFVTHHKGAGNDLVILLSGGASALTALPEWGLDLEGLQAVTDELLRAGANIQELNWVRKHLEQLKGGRLAALAGGATIDVYALSDVDNDDPAVLGSGPAWPDGSTFEDALKLLDRCGVQAPRARRFLEEGISGKHPETPKLGDPAFRHVRHVTIGSNSTAIDAAREAAMRLGFETDDSEHLDGEAKECVAPLLRWLPEDRPSCVLAGGETTVTVGVARGKGGRNQEFALAAALHIEETAGIAVASYATDGVDGPTPSAGAVVTAETCACARRLGLNPEEALAEHDSASFFEALERSGHRCLIKTGATGTNVRDIAFALAYF